MHNSCVLYYWVLEVELTYHSFVIVIPYPILSWMNFDVFHFGPWVSFHFFNILFPIPVMCSLALMNMVIIQVIFVFSLGEGNFFFYLKKFEYGLWLLTQKKRFALDRIEAFSFQETNSSIYRKIWLFNLRNNYWIEIHSFI